MIFIVLFVNYNTGVHWSLFNKLNARCYSIFLQFSCSPQTTPDLSEGKVRISKQQLQ